jgi:hypothetical protein
MEHWYTLYTKPNAEYQVAASLQERGLQTYLNLSSPAICLSGSILSESVFRTCVGRLACAVFLLLMIGRRGCLTKCLT